MRIYLLILFVLAWSSLGCSSDKPSISDLKDDLAKEDWLISRNAAELLSQSGTNALPILLQALKHKSPQVRLLAAESLQAFVAPPEKPNQKPTPTQINTHTQALTELLQSLRSPDALIRRRTAESLAVYAANPIDTDGLILALFDSLENDKDSHVRQYAARALGRLKVSEKNQSAVQTQVVPKLAQLLEKQTPVVKMETSHAILTLMLQLKTLFQESGKEKQVPLDKVEKQALHGLIAVLQDNRQPWIQATAAQALGQLHSLAEPAIPALIQALRSKHPVVFHNAAATLGKISDKVFVPLKKAMEHTDPDTRRRAAYALGQMTHAVNDSIHALERTLAHDKDKSVKEMAQFALQILKIRHKR